MLDQEIATIKNCRDWLRQEVFKPEKEIQIYLPVHIPRLIHQAKQISNIETTYKSKSNIIPHELVDKVNDLCNSICIINNQRENETEIYAEANWNARFLLESYIRYHLCAKKVII